MQQNDTVTSVKLADVTGFPEDKIEKIFMSMNNTVSLETSVGEVGKRMGVTRERIRQIESIALRKLRNPKRSRCLREFI